MKARKRHGYIRGERMAKKSITVHVKSDINKIIDRFHCEDLKDSPRRYIPKFKGSYLYLDRDDGAEGPSPICRLRYTGDMKKWEFEIYKYSSGQYDPDEWMFPGSECVDGTVEGALKAGMKAYT